MKIEIPDSLVRKVQQLDALYGGRAGNFTLIEASVDRMRARIADLLLSEIQREIIKERTTLRITHK